MMKRMTSLEWIKEHVEDINSYIEQNIRVGFQKKGTLSNSIIQKSTEFPGIDSYLFLLASDKEKRMFCYFTCNFLFECIYSIQQLWVLAENNTKESIRVEHILNMLKELKSPLGKNVTKKTFPVYVVTNKELYRGAACIIDKVTIRECCKKLNVENIICMPSSIHEMIFVPYDGESDLEEMSTMVKEINQTIVEPEDQLSDQVFIMKLSLD